MTSTLMVIRMIAAMVESSLFMPCRTLVISSIMRFSPLFVGFDDVDNLLHFRILDAVIVHHAGGCRLEGSLVHVLDEGDSHLCSFDSRIDLIFPGQDMFPVTHKREKTYVAGFSMGGHEWDYWDKTIREILPWLCEG